MAISTSDRRPIWAYEGSSSTLANSTAADVSIVPQARGIYINTTATFQVRLLDGSTPTFNAVPAGTLLPIQFDTLKQSTAAGTFVILT